eukprot:GDKJ01029163.1.p1 GENE.GDKJ01029163.1~~GDKJ01029163.1.p1  ORF type:complete len:158 (+),score=21.67 GDKJ01029163.1:44-475(+)
MIFWKFNIDARQIFLKSSKSFAFVNLKPFVHGHVLISPIRIVQHARDLTDEEMVDLIETTSAAAKILKSWAECDTVATAIQDGPSAGQTVPHVHVHLIPKMDSFHNPLVPDSQQFERKPRTMEEMEAEAAELRDFGMRILDCS